MSLRGFGHLDELLGGFGHLDELLGGLGHLDIEQHVQCIKKL